RCLVADVGEIGTGQTGGLAGQEIEVDAVGDRLVASVNSEDALAAHHVGRRDEDLAVKAPGAQQRGIELFQQVRGCDHHDILLGGGEPVELDQQLVQRLV